MKNKKVGKRGVFQALYREIKGNRMAFFVFLALWLSTLAVLVYSAIFEKWDRVFGGALCLALFLLPVFVEHRFSLQFPTALEVSAYLFVFCAGVA